MKLSKCGRYWFREQDPASPDKESLREEIDSHVEDFLARGGSIKKLSHYDFANKESPLNEQEYKDFFKRNLSFGNKKKIRFNGSIRRGE